MKRTGNAPLGMVTLATAALFMAAFLLLVVFGARTYQQVAQAQAANNSDRALLSYLASCVKGNDSAGRVYWYQSEESPVLVVGDGSGYALHIYCHDGALLEQYSAEGATLNVQNADTLGETQTFTVEQVAENTLRIGTDAGHVLIYLRSEETAA